MKYSKAVYNKQREIYTCIQPTHLKKLEEGVDSLRQQRAVGLTGDPLAVVLGGQGEGQSPAY
jgi:hypothetical protein